MTEDERIAAHLERLRNDPDHQAKLASLRAAHRLVNDTELMAEMRARIENMDRGPQPVPITGEQFLAMTAEPQSDDQP